MRALAGHGVTLCGPDVGLKSLHCQASTLSKSGKIPATRSQVAKEHIVQLSKRMPREKLASQLEARQAVARLQLLRTGNGRTPPQWTAQSGHWHSLSGDTRLDKASLPFPNWHMALTWPWFISGQQFESKERKPENHRTAGLGDSLEIIESEPFPWFRTGKGRSAWMGRLPKWAVDSKVFSSQSGISQSFPPSHPVGPPLQPTVSALVHVYTHKHTSETLVELMVESLDSGVRLPEFKSLQC